MAQLIHGAAGFLPEGSVTLLMLEDSDLDAALIVAALRRTLPGIATHRIATSDEYVAALDAGGFDAVLADYSLPGFDGMRALEIARERAPGTPFLFVSGVMGEEIAIECLQQGATDYVLKQRLNRLPAAVIRAIAEARERAERQRAEERLRLLVAELSHRVKNTLANVLSIARQTLRGADDLQSFETAFVGRLMALSEAHGLLFQAGWGEAALHDILARTLAPFQAGPEARIETEGPPVLLPPKAALALGLMFHELATNAAKYGALSHEDGRVHLAWRLEAQGGERRLALCWRESGGPEVRPPSRRGFGSTLIQRGSAYELDGEVELDFAPAGVVCRIVFPLPVDTARRAGRLADLLSASSSRASAARKVSSP